MANHKHDIGREVLEKKGQQHSHRQLMLYRLRQPFVLGISLNGSRLGAWILHGNYSSSLPSDTAPLTGPLMTLWNLASGYLPATVALTDVVITTVFYALAGKQLFCSWVCSLSSITDLASRLYRRFNLNQPTTIPRHTRYVLLAVALVGLALTSTFIWERINPAFLMGHSLVMGFGNGTLFIPVSFLSDLLVVEHGWCDYICPVGTLYGVLGSKGMITVAASDWRRYSHCMDCLYVCLELYMLRAPVLDEQSSVQVTSCDCMMRGRCVDICSGNVFIIIT